MGEELTRRLMKAYDVDTVAGLNKKLGIKHSAPVYKLSIAKRLQEAWESDPIRDLAIDLVRNEGLDENEVTKILDGSKVNDIARVRLLNYLREIRIRG